MRHLDLFSGIGGFALAARWAGWQTTQFVEIDQFCQKVISKNFPNIPIHGDIKTFDGTKLRGSVDVITGGFPCQRYSIAGEQTGNEPLKDDMLRVFFDIMPQLGVFENVGAFIGKKFAHEHLQLCESLEAKGYEVLTLDIDAASCGLPTLERHIWIVAQAHSERSQRKFKKKVSREPIFTRELSGSYTGEFGKWTIPESRVCGVGERIPDRMDRNKALGNAIPPQVAYEIFKVINDIRR